MQMTSNSIILDKFTPNNYSHLLGTKGFSDQLLTTHFKLYEGYVKNTNAFLAEMEHLKSQGKIGGPSFGELKRRFGWEYNSMKLHELYFDNLGGAEGAQAPDIFKDEIQGNFETWKKWKDDFLGTAGTRGIGWVVLYRDFTTGRLFNCWIDEHNNGHIVGAEALLVLDVFEHAYIADYGVDRNKYLTNFFEQINWDAVENRVRFKGGV